ncbi:MAG: CARDB domain-containing protein [Thermomicrobiales bacterium]
MTTAHASRLVATALITVILGLPVLATHPAAAATTADLAIEMDGGKSHLRFGGTMTLTVTVSNLGPEVASGVTAGIGVSDSLADLGAICPDGSVSNMCNLGSLAPGAVVSFPFVVMACCACCPDHIGIAVASVSADADMVDLVEANNTFRFETRLVGKAPY